MGLKGYRLWAMGQHDSTCRAPPWRPPGWCYPLSLAAAPPPPPPAATFQPPAERCLPPPPPQPPPPPTPTTLTPPRQPPPPEPAPIAPPDPPMVRVDPQTRTAIGRRRNEATSLVHTCRADQWASCKATHNPAAARAARSPIPDDAGDAGGLPRRSGTRLHFEKKQRLELKQGNHAYDWLS
jgi:hypothetical protein